MEVLYWWVTMRGANIGASMLPASVKEMQRRFENGEIVYARPHNRSLDMESSKLEQLFGFRTQKEQLATQQILLSAHLPELERFLTGELLRKVQSGEVMYIRPDEWSSLDNQE